jgi:protein-ribulosamine 3-kinase
MSLRELNNGYLQVAQGEIGKGMVSGEFVSMSTLHSVIPDATPAPIAWGTYASNPEIHFFLCQFLDVTDEVPDVQTFTAKVAELHMKGVSPNGKYGFDVPTYMGQMPQYITWTDSWEEFFTNSLKCLMSLIEEQQGYDPEMKELFDQVLSKAIPRLLRPLETGGRQIKPSLIHGNLYSGNVSVSNETGLPVIYDATCLYAHNECELEMVSKTQVC